MSYVIGKSVKIFRWTKLIAVDTKENSNVIGFYYIHIIEIPSNMGASFKKKAILHIIQRGRRGFTSLNVCSVSHKLPIQIVFVCTCVYIPKLSKRVCKRLWYDIRGRLGRKCLQQKPKPIHSVIITILYGKSIDTCSFLFLFRCIVYIYCFKFWLK